MKMGQKLYIDDMGNHHILNPNNSLGYMHFNLVYHNKNKRYEDMNWMELGEKKYWKLISQCKKQLEKESFLAGDWEKEINFEFLKKGYSKIHIQNSYSNTINIELEYNDHIYKIFSLSGCKHLKKDIIKKIMDVIIPKIIFDSWI